MNKYLIIFLKTGVYFGGVMFLFVVLLHGQIRPAIWSSVPAGILFGVGIAALSYFADQSLLRRGVAVGNSKVRQMREIIIDQNIDEAFKLCKEAILSVSKSTLTMEDTKTGKLASKVGLSWKSFGENLTISIARLSDAQSKIEITSTPVVTTTLADYGKNLENVATVFNYLKQKLNDDIKSISSH